MNIIDGKQIAETIQRELLQKIATFERKIRLDLVVVGENPASAAYIRMKKKACATLGIHSAIHSFPSSITQKELHEKILLLNRDPEIDGILLQLPLPPHIDTYLMTQSVDPTKDVDGFHAINMGKLLIGDPNGFVPCTALGIHELLLRFQIPIDSKHIVIIGRSNIVGKPLAALLVQKNKNANATVTLAHSHTKNLSAITQSADILVAALGRAEFVRSEMVRPGAVVIDVGINRSRSLILGDVHFPSVAPIASWITPVPGGVGPMTVAMLMHNTFLAACRKKQN